MKKTFDAYILSVFELFVNFRSGGQDTIFVVENMFFDRWIKLIRVGVFV
jgi:hypothetical protein